MQTETRNPLKVAHVIAGLGTGGAEMMLLKLLTSIDKGRFASVVVSLTGLGDLGARIEPLGVPVIPLNMSPSLPSPDKLLRLVRLLRKEKPDVVQTWMYHGDLLGGIAARLAGAGAVVWNVQNGTIDARTTKRTTRWVIRACAILSKRLPEAIVCCSPEVRGIHAALGYDEARMTVIPNAVDPGVFAPDATARESVRKELGISASSLLVGIFARFDPQKDHETFFRAAGDVAARFANVDFVLCGRGIESSNAQLQEWSDAAGVRGRTHLLGLRKDIPRLTAALDAAVLSSSYGEGLANSVLEAMSCGVPCIVTDTGGNGSLVGKTGRVVPTRDPVSLAAAMADIVSMDEEARRKLGAKARMRIEAEFSLASVVRRYEELYQRLALRVPGQSEALSTAPLALPPRDVQAKQS